MGDFPLLAGVLWEAMYANGQCRHLDVDSTGLASSAEPRIHVLALRVPVSPAVRESFLFRQHREVDADQDRP